MSDYISRQAAEDAMTQSVCGDTWEVEKAMEAVRQLHAADIVPVVRCKECKFRDNDDFCTGRGFPCQLVPDDGFCDKGERKG